MPPTLRLCDYAGLTGTDPFMTWAEARLQDIAKRRGTYVNATEEQAQKAQKFLDALADGKKIHPAVMNVDNALTEFPSVSVWRWHKNGRPILTPWPPKSP